MKYTKGYKYQLHEKTTIQTTVKGHNIKTNFIELDYFGFLTLRAGYAWDGATRAFDTKDFMKASAAHDALYQLIGLGLLDASHREEADKTLVEVAKKAGMPWLRRKYVYLAVRWLGGQYLQTKKIHEA